MCSTQAALIVGTICEFLRDVSAVLPYVDDLLNDLKIVLVDPIPDVRASGARAMGLLFKGIGGTHFPNLIGTTACFVIVQILANVGCRMAPAASELKHIERRTQRRRSGWPSDRACSRCERSWSMSSQGLAEVLAVRGLTSLSDYLNTILDGATHSDYVVREGYLEVWVYLPRTFGNPLHVHLTRILPTIITVWTVSSFSALLVWGGRPVLTVLIRVTTVARAYPTTRTRCAPWRWRPASRW